MSTPGIVLPSSSGRTFAVSRSSVLANAMSFLTDAPNHPPPVNCEVSSDSEEPHIALTVLAGVLEEGGIRPEKQEILIPGSSAAQTAELAVEKVDAQLEGITGMVVQAMAEGVIADDAPSQ